MNSKQRAYLKGLAMNIDPIMQIVKASLTDENIFSIAESIERTDKDISVEKLC